MEYLIEKNEPPRPIKKHEKDKLMDRYMESQRRREQGLKLSRGEVKKGYIFPEHRPFFKGIIKDDKDRIYVFRFKSPLDKEKYEKYDLFSKEGYYLYKVTMPSIPFPVIKNGYIYTYQLDKDTGFSRVIRYRIKNWDQIETQKRHSNEAYRLSSPSQRPVSASKRNKSFRIQLTVFQLPSTMRKI